MPILMHLLIAVVMAAATWGLGWWGVAVVAVIEGFLYRADGGRAWQAALAATEGWLLLLVFDTLSGPMARVASTLSGAMAIPAPLLLLATLLFPALLAGSVAVVAAELGILLAKPDMPVPRTS